MSPKGIQLNISDIRGGMLADLNPVRLPANAFQSIINAEYTKLGKIMKSQGYSILPLTTSGEVRDIKGVFDAQGILIGYLIAQDVLRYVNDLGSPTVDSNYTEIISLIVPGMDGWYYYISGSSNLGRLMKWRIKSGTIKNIGTEIRKVGETEFNVYKANEASNPFRVNSKDLANDDSSLILKWKSIGAGEFTFRPKSFSKIITVPGQSVVTDPEKAYDTDASTFAALWNSRQPNSDLYVTYFNFQTPLSGVIVAEDVTLSVSYSVMYGATGYGTYVNHSIDGGETFIDTPPYFPAWIWTDSAQSPKTLDPYIYTDTLVLTGPVDLSKLQIKIHHFSGWFKVWDIKATSVDVGAVPRIKITTGSDHPGIIGKEKFNRIVIPIKTNSLTVSKDVILKVEEVQKESGAVYREESHDITVLAADEEIDHTLTEAYFIHEDDGYYTRITLYPDTPDSSSDSLTFHRAKRWATLNDGIVFIENDTGGEVTYSDREPLMAFGLQDTLNVAIYGYSSIFITDTGIESSYDFIKVIELIADDLIYFDLGILKTAIENAANEDIETLVICKSLVGGAGFLYRHKELSLTSFDNLLLEDTTTDIWNMTTPKILPPKFMTDNRDVPLGVPVLDEDTSADFDMAENSLLYFRNRLWCIAKEADASGVIRTFIRYSDVDLLSSWPDLNVLGIPDLIEEIRPLREDMLLAFSLTKTYRITPFGGGFDYLKIADVGCKSGISVAAYDMIFWLNQYGLYVFDGASVTLLQVSLANLSLIKKFDLAQARVCVVTRDQKVMWTAMFDGANYGLVYDLTLKALTLRIFNQPLLKYIELDNDLTGPIYCAMFGANLGLYGGYTEEGGVIQTVIKSRRFQALDASLIRLYYFGFVFNGEAQGEVTVTFTFAAGTQIVNTINLADAELVGEQKVSKIQVYGNDEWFEFEVVHSSDAPFEIREFYLGIAATILNFPERPLNA